ncbi:uncharacterized protein V1518DRAFT_369331 [Limtongia smithiae]|uniref:uncharacterized protein n=1 Tax=Limtongia smithiae TaxID=1125753 RepID=UPI0034CDC0A8
MPILEKYQTLPDLDQWSPELFETPDRDETAHDNVILHMRTACEQENEDIDYTTISADTARARFLNRTFQTTPGSFDSRDDDEGKVIESSSMKLQRLKSEVDDLYATLASGDGSLKQENMTDASTVEEISELARRISSLIHEQSANHSDLINALGRRAPVQVAGDPSSLPVPADDKQVKPTSTPPPPPANAVTTEKAELISLEARIDVLERALGSTASVSFAESFSSTVFEQPIVPTLASLTQKISALTASSGRLEAVAASTSASQAAIQYQQSQPQQKHTRPSTADSISTAAADELVPVLRTQDIAQINALHGSLASVEKLARIVPPLIDRLKTLRYVHAEAGASVTNLVELRGTLIAAEKEAEKWDKVLGAVEKKMDVLEMREKENLKAVEAWIKELEQKMAAL